MANKHVQASQFSSPFCILIIMPITGYVYWIVGLCNKDSNIAVKALCNIIHDIPCCIEVCVSQPLNCSVQTFHQFTRGLILSFLCCMHVLTRISMLQFCRLMKNVKVYNSIDLPMENLEHSMCVLLEILKKCTLY